eukprot:scaffold12939_cov63-Phaeocystis_antarctica.AAC.4
MPREGDGVRARTLCGKAWPPRGLGRLALQHAPPALVQAQGALQPRPPSVSFGQPLPKQWVDLFWLAGQTSLVFHTRRHDPEDTVSHLRLGIKPSGTHAANAPHAQRTFVLEVSYHIGLQPQPHRVAASST